MILLLGGTAETAPLAQALLDQGLEVLVSTATDAPLALPDRVSRRCGRLDPQGLAELCAQAGIRVLVDAGHPYAVELHAACAQAAAALNLPLLRWLRPRTELPPEARAVPDHETAAALAFSLGGPVLLTTGSRHLAPYVQEARRTGWPILARVLDLPESLRACRDAGLEAGELAPGRGPHGLGADRALIRRHRARALVTKDSGTAGGLEAKLQAARLEGCAAVVVTRPEPAAGGCSDPQRLALLAAGLHRR
jgi:precorrin-6A/cobalt-precorrin-6A reductase